MIRPKLTVLCMAKNCASYAEVFFRSAALHGFHSGDGIELLMLVGESDDGTEAVCREWAPRLPAKAELIFTADLSPSDRQRMEEVQRANADFFNEGMWDFLREIRPLRTEYYAGIHTDVEFLAPGLWEFLIERIGDAAVAGIFHPGELIEEDGRLLLQLPRLFPLVTIVNTRQAESLQLSWGRGPADTPDAPFVSDNGTLALYRAVRSRIALIREEELAPYIRHFGFMWTSRYHSTLHWAEGERSREALSRSIIRLRAAAASPTSER